MQKNNMPNGNVFALSAAATVIFLAGCNDPKGRALDIFRQQGLTVLQPARDYIKPGGLVLVPKAGAPVYLDPYDTPVVENAAAVNFSAVVMAEDMSSGADFGLTLNLIHKLLPLEAGLKASTTSQVSLSQIDSAGTRLPTTVVTGLIKKDATKAAIQEQLGQKDGARLFLIQEVYTGKGLTLTSTNKKKLGLAMGSELNIADCAAKADNAKTDNTSDPATKSPSSKQPPSEKSQPGDAAKKQDATSPVGSTAAAPPKGGSDDSTGNKTPTQGGSIGYCHMNDYSLKFTSVTNIPFAVRLVEIELRGGTPAVKYGDFKFPGTLGDSQTARMTAELGPDPVLPDLEHRSHK